MTHDKQSGAELKACPSPWCEESKPELQQGGFRNRHFRVECQTCFIKGPTRDDLNGGGPAAIAAWNTRSLPQAGEGVVERVARAMAWEAGYGTDAWNSTGFQVRSLEALARAAIAALPPAGRVEQWQPIETAPKDGRRIDLWVEHTSGLGKTTGQRFTNAKWYAERWTDNYGNALEWRVGPVEVEEGCSPDEGRTVTHWRPLPEPPALSTQGASS